MQKDPVNPMEKFLFSFEEWFNLLFKPDTLESHPWFSRTWLAGLLIAGIVAWGTFFNYGAFPLTLKDWANVTGPRLAMLQDALKKGVLPLHLSDTAPLDGFTDRYMSLPDQVLSPQVLALRFMSLTRFIFLDVVLLYLVGFLGLLWFMRKFSLSLVAFTILFLLFNFNGHILAHLAIGHFVWGGYFLFPWFAALAFRLMDGELGWGWVAKMALLLLAIFLQGSYHQFIWCLFFLAFLSLVKRGAFLTVVGGAAFGLLTSMVRILPAAIIYGSFNSHFSGGFLSLNDIWFSLTNTLEPGENATVPLMNQAPQRWELTLYIGLAGALFLIFFGVYRWLRGENGKIPYLGLALPILASFLFSFNLFYQWVRLLPIPLVLGERVPARILILAFVFILLFAVIEFQRWLDQPRKSYRLIYLATIVLLFIGGGDLYGNYRLWLPARVGKIYPVINFQRGNYLVANHSDPAYVTALAVGAAISLLSVALVLFLAYRERRRASSAAPTPSSPRRAARLPQKP